MKNIFDKLNEIMEPYFKKKEYLENLNIDINTLKLRLEKLIANRNREIENYIKESISSNPRFYSGYGSMIRKDLQQAYKEKENELKKNLAFLEHLNLAEKEKLNELIIDLQKQLISEQDVIKNKLNDEQIHYNSIMTKLSDFQYEYNEQSQVINGNDWRNLYQTSIEINDNINTLQQALEKSKEYLGMFESTEIKEEVVETEIISDDKIDLLNTVYNEIIKEIEKLKSNEQCLSLPCGEEVIPNDINKAIEILYSKDKGKTYIVKENLNQQGISKDIIDAINQQLKKYSTQLLFKDSKISQADLFRVFGKEESKRIIEETKANVSTNEDGYILKTDILEILNKVFEAKEETLSTQYEMSVKQK
ncbi:MAG: hypothetical protein IKL65_03785 [Bacilli bacterium]|nr:hypothetical protein [Bacilli bacterium]